MKVYSTIFFLIIFLASCSPKLTHLYEAKPLANTLNKDNTFENDTVRISYSFWSEGGVFSFSVYNKLSVPLYIDWKKSSFVKNSDKLNYWSDEVITQSTGTRITGLSYWGNSLLSLETGFSSSVKPEQVTFVAPKSTIYKIQFALHEKTARKLHEDPKTITVARNDNPKQTTTVKFVEYNENTTPLRFRNFMTLSTSDKFDKEFYVDNGFYLYKISEMIISHLTGSSTSLGADLMKTPSPYRNKLNYYVLKVQ